MDKRTILAIVISVVIFGGWYLLTQVIFKPEPSVNLYNEPKTETDNRLDEESSFVQEAKPSYSNIVPIEEEGLTSEELVLSTNKVRVVFSTKGAVVKSFQLNDYTEKDGQPVEMVFNKKLEKYPFGISFGELNTENVLFKYEKSLSSNEIVFSRTFKKGEEGESFILKKVFKFRDNDYLFTFDVILESTGKEAIPLDAEGILYTLSYGPQIGPAFEKLDDKNEFRKYPYFSDGKLQEFKIGKNKTTIDKIAFWAGIEGKYFIVLASLPSDLLLRNSVEYNADPSEFLKNTSTMFFKRPAKKSSIIEDKYKFYVGPKKKEYLNIHSSLYFDKAIKPIALINWLVDILKWMLINLQKWVGNWGVAIILVTLIIKIVLFPLTQKGFKSNTKLQSLAPKVNELKEKYKDDPQTMNAKTMELYKKEGVNPMGGCLPLLIQMPIFIAFYNLLSTHFELREAVFIPGWINDLSAPETFITLPFTIPFLGNELRLLPFIMLAMTFIQQQISQSPSTTTGQMKLMLYAMPLFFFFILYNMPSGLVVYWTVQNILSIFQQMYINQVLKSGKDKGKDNKPGILDKIKLISRSKK